MAVDGAAVARTVCIALPEYTMTDAVAQSGRDRQ
jgi:hypothetical protein